MDPERFSHRNCTFILDERPKPFGPRVHPYLRRGFPRFLRERTHGCWCSSWRLTRNGMRIWRRGAWRKPKPGELRRVKGEALERWKLLGYE